MLKIFWTCKPYTVVIVTQLGGRQRGGGGGVVSVDEEEAEDDDETHGEENTSIEKMFLQTELSQNLGHAPSTQCFVAGCKIFNVLT